MQKNAHDIVAYRLQLVYSGSGKVHLESNEVLKKIVYLTGPASSFGIYEGSAGMTVNTVGDQPYSASKYLLIRRRGDYFFDLIGTSKSQISTSKMTAIFRSSLSEGCVSLVQILEIVFCETESFFANSFWLMSLSTRTLFNLLIFSAML